MNIVYEYIMKEMNATYDVQHAMTTTTAMLIKKN